MDGSYNPIVFLCKIFGVVPIVPLNCKNKLHIALNTIYNIALIVIWIICFKLRMALSNVYFNDKSILSTIGMNFRMILPLVINSSLAYGNFAYLEAHNEVFMLFKEFDAQVIYLQKNSIVRIFSHISR